MSTPNDYVPKKDINEVEEYFNDVEATERCYETGEYTDDCDCEMCDHRFDCSDYEGDDWED